MTAPAYAAIGRIDDGLAQPGDAEIAAVFERHLQWEQARYDDRRREQEYADWLAVQCPAHEEGGRGELCGDCEVAW